MGQQQLLMVVLGIIVVGIAVTAGILMFRQNAIDMKREELVNESITLAQVAISYFKRPLAYGGGGHRFTGWRVPTEMDTTAAGYFRVTVFQDSLILIGTGNEMANDNDSVEVRTTVRSSGYSVTIVH